MEWCKKCLAGLWKFVTRGGVLLGFLAGVITMILFVRNLVHQTATDDEFLHKVASHVRPALIIDEKFHILADQGGSEYIEDIDISLSAEGHPTQMVIHAKSHLGNEPYVQSMSANEYMITTVPGRKYDWIVKLVPFGTVCDKNHKFRIEVIK